MKINAIKCLQCESIIYSRFGHDFRHCSCGACFVDGGRDYFRYGYTDIEKIQVLELELDQMNKVDKYKELQNLYYNKVATLSMLESQLDALEDEMDNLWETLTKEEIEQIDGKCQYTREQYEDINLE